jgi:hypothetical protein
MGQLSRETIQRLFVLYMIESFDRAVYGGTRLQKVGYYAAKNAEARPVTFINYHYGEFSRDIQTVLEQLISMRFVNALPLDTGTHGNQYVPVDKSLLEYHRNVLVRISPQLPEAIERSVKDYGYLTDAGLLKLAKNDDLLKASKHGDEIIASNLDASVAVDLDANECDELELAMNPRFIAAMTGLIEGIESGEIKVDQWEEVA